MTELSYLLHPVITPDASFCDTVPEDDSKIRIVYVPSHLYHILFELFKNSMRAVMEANSLSEQYPPIEVTLVKGREDICVKSLHSSKGWRTSVSRSVPTHRGHTPQRAGGPLCQGQYPPIEFTLVKELEDICVKRSHSSKSWRTSVSRSVPTNRGHTRQRAGGHLCQGQYPPIEVTLIKELEDICVKISDRGGGIPRSQTDQLFNYMFSTAPQPPKSDAHTVPLAGETIPTTHALIIVSYLVWQPQHLRHVPD
uniref:Protein-serine/threonine kinase n=1 Tax=Timema douglasi TaxID=61478 RepID=A0A7R8W2L0_TIMDO|nr:unnamed protein product [Timema douglasi]